jgi:hypothetical protein
VNSFLFFVHKYPTATHQLKRRADKTDTIAAKVMFSQFLKMELIAGALSVSAHFLFQLLFLEVHGRSLHEFLDFFLTIVRTKNNCTPRPEEQ